jgi:hypothetical protein
MKIQDFKTIPQYSIPPFNLSWRFFIFYKHNPPFQFTLNIQKKILEKILGKSPTYGRTVYLLLNNLL